MHQEVDMVGSVDFHGLFKHHSQVLLSLGSGSQLGHPLLQHVAHITDILENSTQSYRRHTILYFNIGLTILWT